MASLSPTRRLLAALALLAVTAAPALGQATRARLPLSQADWWNRDWRFRGVYRTPVADATTLTVKVSFSRLLAKLGAYRKAFDVNSIRLVEHAPDGKPLGKPLPFAFERTARFSVTHNATGVLSWRIPKRPGAKGRAFGIYFDTEENGLKPKPPAPEDPPTPNLVANGDFEKRPKVNPPWKMTRRGRTFYYPVWSDTAARSGSHSMRARTDRRASSRGYTPKIPVTPGKAYRMSVWYKVDSVGAGEVMPLVNFVCYVMDKEKGKLVWTKMCRGYAVRHQKPGPWVHVSKVVAPPPGATRIFLDFGIYHSHGAAWFDDADIRLAEFDEVTEVEALKERLGVRG